MPTNAEIEAAAKAMRAIELDIGLIGGGARLSLEAAARLALPALTAAEQVRASEGKPDYGTTPLNPGPNAGDD